MDMMQRRGEGRFSRFCACQFHACSAKPASSRARERGEEKARVVEDICLFLRTHRASARMQHARKPPFRCS